jgi:diguanylate cyclase (GGDEF)-like protein/PAS domain S-box-containing protein
MAMVDFFRHLAIRKKLLLILFISSISAVTFAGLFLFLLEISEFKKTTQEELSAMATFIGDRSTAALMFDDKEVAKENLSALDKFPSVRLACIYDVQNNIFTLLDTSPEKNLACPTVSPGKHTRYEENQLYIYQPIILDNEAQGLVYIHADLETAFLRKFQHLGLVSLILFSASILAFFILTPLLQFIASPIKKLVDTVQKITEEKNYSLRAEKVNHDELGDLVDAFNDMIGTVETQNIAITKAKDRYLMLYDDNPTMIFNIDTEGWIATVNRFGAKQLGLTVEELQTRCIFGFVHPEDLLSLQSLFKQCKAYPKKVHKQEVRLVCENDHLIWVRQTARLMENEEHRTNIMLVCEDVTETRILSEKIAYQASHDALTNLANRSEFDLYILHSLETAHSDSAEHALCYLDLDQFKVVNDTSGHIAGDELLRQLGALLRKHIRKEDLLARLGGDEFGILMHDCSLDHAYRACEKIRNVIRDFNFAWEDRSFTVGVSIGVTAISGTSGNAVELLKEADAACYAAKDKGRNRVHVFRPDDEDLAQRQGEMQWVEKIHQGLNENRFSLYGQIIVPVLGEEEGLHFETLIRYKDINGQIVPPGAFLPAAERYNQAPILDRWVIKTLFSWMAKQPDFVNDLKLCSINLSGLSFSDETMLDFIIEQFNRWLIPPEKVCFEITETAAIANLSDAVTFIQQLKKHGCYFSLDDFGSGLSSFAYLKNLPVDFIKIDGLFVKDILDDKVDLAMVRSINEVGHVMEKKTVAEFVENEEILAVLKQLGVDYAQGFAIGEPVPLDELVHSVFID